ncbi:flagellar hook-length control protein FliK [Frigoribacterium sp. 2-23]|uniref:flagellar hook-length control protein FliK n=1 Tax=Frigoribacterium sp. 2-23 TaxID=3415006 RepID=UPI003C703334
MTATATTDPAAHPDPAPAPVTTPLAAPAAAAPLTTASAAPSGAATANAQPPLAQQLFRPLFSLAAAGPGQHVVTVTVSPESLGTVTVRAHVGAHGMHVEMFAASDAGRDAVRAILPDLRRDLGGQGMQASVDLSSQNQPSDPRGGREPGQTSGDGQPQRPAEPPVSGVARATGADGRPGSGQLETDLHDLHDPHRASSSLLTSLDVLA